MVVWILEVESFLGDVGMEECFVSGRVRLGRFFWE